MSTRYTQDGTVYTSWSIEDGDLLGPALTVRQMIQDFGGDVLWLSRANDTERLNRGLVEPCENIIAIGPNGSDYEYGNALKSFALRHGVKRVYRIMSCPPRVTDPDSEPPESRGAEPITWAEMNRRRAIATDAIGKAQLTCETCTKAQTCEFSFDPYNTNGDCLEEK